MNAAALAEAIEAGDIDPAAEIWTFVAQKARLEAALASRVWALLTDRQDIHDMRAHFVRALRCSPTRALGLQRATAALLCVWGDPKRLIGWLEEAVAAQRLTRAEATNVEEHLFALLMRTGMWK
jgi:hypothetical protein